MQKRRRDMFREAFDHVEREIGQIYKLLTSDGSADSGGTVDLTLDNEDVRRTA